MNEKTLKAALAIALIIGGGGITGSLFTINDNQVQYDALMVDYMSLLNDYGNLTEDYDILAGEFSSLNQVYYGLIEDYNTLSAAFDELNQSYYMLLASYTAITGWIKDQILPLQLSTWAEAVRQYYLDDYYLDLAGSTKEWYMQFARFCRDIVLQNTGQSSPFSEVTEAFEDALRYGTDIERLTDRAMDDMSRLDGESAGKFPYHWGWVFSSLYSEIWGAKTITQYCTSSIDYEFDTDITYSQLDATWDYPKFPVETAFRTMGDCEDQAILLATYLETSWWVDEDGYKPWETAIAIFHDPSHPTTHEPFYHGTLLVHIEDPTDFFDNFPSGKLWRLGSMDPYYYDGFTWCFVDPTWDVPFGSIPSWLVGYGNSIPDDVLSMAINDYNGNIGQTGNGPIGTSMP